MSKDYQSLARDDNRAIIHVGTDFSTVDADGNNYPQTSIGSGSPTTINIPKNAAEMVIFPDDTDLRLSEESTITRYDLITQGTKEVIGVANTDSLYVQADSGTLSNLYVRFILV